MIRINYQNHIIIFGYSSLTAGVIKLLRGYFGDDFKIVLISNDIKHNPFPEEVDFIYANPIDRDTFVEANARQAIASIILANDRFLDPDAYSLVIATGVEMYNSRSVTIVELMDDEYKNLYKQGNIEAFIKRKELLKDMLQNGRDSKLIRIIQKETPLEQDKSSGSERNNVDLL
jgi:voltage-gated potassium channel Kch